MVEDNDVRRYLCATLPFFMSEMMSASPGFLLEGAVKREENNQTLFNITTSLIFCRQHC